MLRLSILITLKKIKKIHTAKENEVISRWNVSPLLLEKTKESMQKNRNSGNVIEIHSKR